MARKIVYPIFPSRLSMEAYDRFLEFLHEKGYAPFDHRRGAPFKWFENEVGRPRTLEFLIKQMRSCDAAAVGGISSGGMSEFAVALEIAWPHKKFEVCGFYGFDPEWDKYYEELKPEYGDLIRELRGPNRLIAFVGPRAVGKTFWIDTLLEESGGAIGRIKNTTTRIPRNDADCLSYNFVSKEEFELGLKEYRFLEHDWNENNGRKDYYGSSLESIRAEVSRRNSIFALTPAGAAALYERRFEFNLTIILLKSESDEVLRRNLVRRGITDPAEQEALIEKAHQFVMPDDVPHKVVMLSGKKKIDHERIISAIFR